MRILPQDNTKTYFLEVPSVGLWVLPNQTIADSVYRYLTTTANGALARADIDAVSAILASAPSYKAFYGGPVSAAPGQPGAIDYDKITADIDAALKDDFAGVMQGTIPADYFSDSDAAAMEGRLLAALAKIKFPTKGTVELS